MPTWATVTITLGASLIAVTGTLLAGLVRERRADARAEKERRRERVDAGMDVLARVEILLSDADPARLGMNLDRQEPFGAWKPLSDEWHGSLRLALTTYTLADESPTVRDLGRKLGVAVSTSLNSTGWMLREMVPPKGNPGQLQIAESDHAKARELASQLETVIRGS
jgi:hypothetical protein